MKIKGFGRQHQIQTFDSDQMFYEHHVGFEHAPVNSLEKDPALEIS